MDNEKIVTAFDKFVDDRYAESEEDLRSEIRKAVNDHLKNKLSLENDPIDISNTESDDDTDNTESDDDTDNIDDGDTDNNGEDE